ncbi:MAG: endospore germination permease [Clostridia bacterium]|nr:endospore germination permease [Clostridia bacterium]
MATLRDGQIGYREAMALLATTLTMHVFLTLPQHYIIEGKTAGWMLPMVDFLFTLGVLFLWLPLVKANPHKTIVEVAEESGGPITGTLVGVLIFIYFVFLTVIIMRQFTETVIVALLPTTPISVISILFLVAMIYSAYQGIESLSRGAWLLMPFIIIGLLGVLALILPRANPVTIFPFWGSGIPEILKFGVIKSFLPMQIILISMLIPYLRDKTRLTTVAVGSLTISAVLIALTVLVYIMVFPVPSSINSGPYPLENLARLIYYGRFIQRVESIFIFIWIFGMLVKASALFYLAAISLARGLKLPEYRPLLFPLVILVYGLNFMIPNFPTAVWLDKNIYRSFGWILAITIPALVWLLYKLKGKGGDSHGQPQNSN